MTLIVAPIAASDPATLTDMAQQAREQGADLIELRLDHCAAAGATVEDCVAAIPQLALPVLATNRCTAEGGAWDGAETRRLELLLAADRVGAWGIDVELAALEHLPYRPERARLLLSHHDFTGPGSNLATLIERMYGAGAAIAKVAVTARDAADLDPLAELCARFGCFGDEASEGRGLVTIAMGEAGLPSRLLAGAWGQALTFGRLDGDPGSAPGQPRIADLARLYRVRAQGADTRIFGVLGDPVGHSLSPVIHNTAFIHNQCDAVYVPFLAQDGAAFWQACGSWIDGLSITIPHKTALIKAMDELEELALQIGAINTIYRGENGQCVGANTDAPAAVECIEELAGDLHGRQVLLLGAGGVGRAIACACVAAGAQLLITNRSLDRAQALAAEVHARALSLEQALEEPYEVLINGTSVGLKSLESPWPAERHRPGSVVFDTIYQPMETALLRDAQLAGARPICGLKMLIRQALGQYQRWTGHEAPEHLMQRAALEALGTGWTTAVCREPPLAP